MEFDRRDFLRLAGLIVHLDLFGVGHKLDVVQALVVLGGGIIGCEYATIFSTAGTKVRLVDKRHEILASVDREIVGHLGERMVHQGMELILQAELEKIRASLPAWNTANAAKGISIK